MESLIYVVEDDKNIRELIIIALQSYSYSAVGFDNAKAAICAIAKQQPSLAIFDIMLPDLDGISAVKLLRQNKKYNNMAIIILTAKDSEADKIEGLDVGADDYITKPFSILELMARIRCALRHSTAADSSNESTKIFCGDIVINCESREVFAGSRSVLLTYKEFELLKFLALNKNKVAARDEILNKVWGFDYTGETRTVDIHIKTLRQKLGESGILIKTSRSVGYMLSDKAINQNTL